MNLKVLAQKLHPKGDKPSSDDEIIELLEELEDVKLQLRNASAPGADPDFRTLAREQNRMILLLEQLQPGMSLAAKRLYS